VAIKDSKRVYRIGVDARPLSWSVSGVSRVISQIISAFPDKKNYRFLLYSSLPCHEDYRDLRLLPNVEWAQGSGWTTKKAGLWYNAGLPFQMRRDRLDLFWGSQQQLPPFLPKGLPAVLTFYDLVAYFFPGSMRAIHKLQHRLSQKYSVNRAAEILTISAQTGDDLVRLFQCPREKVRPALLGYLEPPSLKKPTEKLASLPAKFMLAVSTLEPRKNYSTLLKAYRIYLEKERRNPMPLVIAGRRGWESPEFYEMLETMLVETRSLFLMDDLSDSELKYLYDHCSFFAMSSLYEGFGLPLLEAMASGKFALASDLPCFHEIGGNQFQYLPPTDANSWAQAIADSARLAREGRLRKIKFSKKEWSWEKTASLHLEAFERLLS